MLKDITVFNIREYLSGKDDKVLGEDALQHILYNTMKRKIARVSELDEENGTYTLSAYLIAQLGKNFCDGANERITGEQLLQAVLDTIKELQYMAGGMVIFLETENNEKLMKFYGEKNGFKRFDMKEVKTGTNDAYTLIQLLKISYR